MSDPSSALRARSPARGEGRSRPLRTSVIQAWASVILVFGLAPAHAASITTEDFAAIVQPTVVFLEESSRLAPGRTDSARIRAFARAEAREQAEIVASLAAWRQSEQVSEAKAAAAPTIDGLGPTFNALAVPLGTLADTTHLLPTPPFTRLPSADQATAAARDEVARLAALHDAAFDARYAEAQAGGLRRLVALYKDFILNGDDETLRRLAVHELPRAERRLAEIAGRAS